MTWGISTALFIELHVALSIVGIAAGLVVLYGMIGGHAYRGWTHLFLATTVLTSVTGFPLPPFGMDPPRVLGIVSLLLLAVALVGFYLRHLEGAWRLAFVVSGLAALYLNAFVAVVQSFQKLPTLQSLAPTQTEPPFIAAQLLLLVAFVALGIVAARNFRTHPVRG